MLSLENLLKNKDKLLKRKLILEAEIESSTQVIEENLLALEKEFGTRDLVKLKQIKEALLKEAEKAIEEFNKLKKEDDDE